MPHLSSVDKIGLTAWLKSKSNEPIKNSFANHLLKYEGKCCNYHLTFHFNLNLKLSILETSLFLKCCSRNKNVLLSYEGTHSS